MPLLSISRLKIEGAIGTNVQIVMSILKIQSNLKHILFLI